MSWRFDAGARAWIERLASLRNIVRQDLIERQLADHVTAGMRVLDVGCGHQGTQAIRLARRGCAVLGVDPSRELLQRLAIDAQAADVAVETRLGTLEDLPRVVGERTFDLVCAHGLLMYLPDTRGALELLAARVAAGGMLSVTFRNAAALAFRPGMRGRWKDARDAIDAQSYVNELGVQASAHSLDDLRGSYPGAQIHLITERLVA